MKREKIRRFQDIVLKNLSGRIDDFYLAGGTALSLVYFQHRSSVDLDFFTPVFSPRRVKEIITYLEQNLKKNIELAGQNLSGKVNKILIYYIYFTAKDILKIDFVEDTMKLLRPIKTVEGIKILSLEDIYLRKLYTISGALPSIDKIGRIEITGGRIEAKDFYDLYMLSNTFMNISKFITRYGNPIIVEGIIRWFRTYDRISMADGVLTLEVNREMDYKKIEGHFKKEIDKIIERQLENI